jgi:hypothetical protein
MISELFSRRERKPIGYILSNSKSLIYLVGSILKSSQTQMFNKVTTRGNSRAELSII